MVRATNRSGPDKSASLRRSVQARSWVDPTGQVTYLAPIRARYHSEVDKRIGDFSPIQSRVIARYISIEPTSSAAQDRFERRPSLLGWRIDLAQETICDDESAVAVAGMRARAIDHSAKKPATVQRRDASQLVVAGAPGVAEVLGQ
jgi:hypothetical protein